MSKVVCFFVVFLGYSFCSMAQGIDSTLTILNYNAYHGFSGDADLEKSYVEWVKEIDPDIVAYQEMNQYSQNAIGELASNYGHPYAVIMNKEFGVPVTHPLAITSKFPILDVKRVIDNMWHGYMYANIEGLHLFITHLAPFTLSDRKKDIRKIIAQVDLLPEDERIIIAGDFNSLSSKDSTFYGERLLNSMKRIEGRREPKSETPIVRNRIIYRKNLNKGKVDYSVIQQLIDHGFYDSFYLKNDNFKHTVPTSGHAKKSSKLRRIDYVWVSKSLSNYLSDAQIIQDETTDHLSDHYPILIKLDFNKN